MYDMDPVSFHTRATSLEEIIEQQHCPRTRLSLRSAFLHNSSILAATVVTIGAYECAFLWHDGSSRSVVDPNNTAKFVY